jgi:choline dehydrogenase-like flavoprotein
MLQDADNTDSASLGADICVVGGGPAGLTVAAELAEAGVDVVVLEAGGLPYDRHDPGNRAKVIRDHLRGAQSLTRGRTRGEPYYPLRMSRARGLAGSTNALMPHGLRGRPLDPIDFRPRFESTWPIPYDDLVEHVPEAEVYTGMRATEDDAVDWMPQSLDLGSERSLTMLTAPFRHGDRSHFATMVARLAVARRPRLVTSAVVIGFSMDRAGRVKTIDAVSLSGKPLTVNAEVFVLAAGGIDNARVLLGSRPLLYAMDDAADNVGRRFMEHPHYLAGYLVPGSADAFVRIGDLFGDPMQPSCWLTPHDAAVVDEGLLRVAVAAVPVHAESLDPAVPAAGELLRIAPYGPYGLRPRLAQATTALRGGCQVLRAGRERLRNSERTIYALAVMSEQPPMRESRVVLGPRSDRMGMALPELRWQVGERGFASARRTIELLAADTERAGLGRIVSLWDQGMERPRVVTGGWHHMGTTAMSSSPMTGVVDGNCRVHGVPNLYVAGSSVFPTSGYANPTLTLVALAARLGKHLIDVIT